MSKPGPVVLITGASSGIGDALAHEFFRRGARIVAVARRLERLQALAEALGDPARVMVQRVDVDVDGEIDVAVAAAKDRFGQLDVVVANAGFSVAGSLEQLSVGDYKRQFETNVFGMVRTVHASLEGLRASRGRLALMGSVAGYLPVPGAAAYSMSKYAVRALAESLSIELAAQGISVTHIAPGFVESDIRLHADAAIGQLHERDPAPPWLVMPREKAARLMADAIERRSHEVILTWHGRLGAFLGGHLPEVAWSVLRAAGPYTGSRSQ